jgi:hypothetical protein
MRAVKETLRVTVTDGVLNLYFAKGAADNALVSAIEVLPVTAAARLATEEAGEPEGRQVNLYPNPVQDKLTVKLSFPAAQVKGTAVTDASGSIRLVNAHEATGHEELQLEVALLPKGFYLLRLNTKQGNRIIKFLKQ